MSAVNISCEPNDDTLLLPLPRQLLKASVSCDNLAANDSSRRCSTSEEWSEHYKKRWVGLVVGGQTVIQVPRLLSGGGLVKVWTLELGCWWKINQLRSNDCNYTTAFLVWFCVDWCKSWFFFKYLFYIILLRLEQKMNRSCKNTTLWFQGSKHNKNNIALKF